MGKKDSWFLDDRAIHGNLGSDPSLVMFDGLDEIFDTADRERVIQAIAGFALRYPRARIIVTSRPVGYKEKVLRAAGFAHFGIQDLADETTRTLLTQHATDVGLSAHLTNQVWRRTRQDAL